ncbi:MAG: riboflavin synthase [Actinobacteria bacterium]|nr:MAG: riboflavin synthase [Actinomycetota bacterium]
MFTGIVQDTGLVTGVESSGDEMTITIDSEILAAMSVGGSVAVNGACLTAVTVGDGTIQVNAVTETMNRTNLGDLSAGDRVNLELPVSAGSLLDGHIVQGHIDATGTISGIMSEGESVRIRVDVPEAIQRYLVEKGSVAVDGISLTVASLHPAGFDVAVIPHTRDVTTLGRREVGDRVNIEVDVLAKYVERLMAR